MKIIKLQKDKLKQALNLVWTVFDEFESPDYSKEGIEEFKNFISYDSISKKFDNKELGFWGYIDNNNLIGIIATRNINHICLLFVDKKYHKNGIARNLFNIVKNTCENHKDINSITVNSSPYAIEFYHKIGFIDTDKLNCINGIKFIPMIYLIQ